MIITGMPGAGKSTVARQVALGMGRAALIEGDWVTRLTVSGFVSPLGEPADEAARQVALCNRNLCALAANYVDAGFTAVIDWIIPNTLQLGDFCEMLAPRLLLLVVLAPGIAVCQDRNAARDPSQRWNFEGYENLEREMSRDLGMSGWWFDTSELTAEQTADQIIHDAPQRAIISTS